MKKHAESIFFPGQGALGVYAAVLFFGSVWLALILCGSLLMESGDAGKITACAVRFFFGPVCHQIPERSFKILGYPLAVCARCTGVYVGFLLGAIAFPAFQRKKTVKTPSLLV
ncbi:MAG TPA: DUF2085 domain-containing protein, partial [bacterium]